MKTNPARWILALICATMIAASAQAAPPRKHDSRRSERGNRPVPTRYHRPPTPRHRHHPPPPRVHHHRRPRPYVGFTWATVPPPPPVYYWGYPPPPPPPVLYYPYAPGVSVTFRF
jgi:hypothetical protein